MSIEALIAESRKLVPLEQKDCTFWVFGAPGSGKTQFALGLARIGKLLYIGTEKGAHRFIGDKKFPGWTLDDCLEVRSLAAYRGAVKAVSETRGYAGVIIDTMSDIYEYELTEAQKVRNGEKYIPISAWQTIRSNHKAALRVLRDAPIHKVFISQEKEIYADVEQTDGTMSKELVGFKIDSEKKDGYVADVVLRTFRKGNEFSAEVYKDRTGHYGAAEIIQSPQVEMWVK